jgi:hypothetical protein
MADFDFNAVLDAVGSYYGTGSDQWVEFAKYGLQADNLYDTLKHVPGVDIVYTNSGKVVGATVSKISAAPQRGPPGRSTPIYKYPRKATGQRSAARFL